MSDPFGFGTNLLGVTARPGGDPRTFTSSDTFAVDCTTPTSEDGTDISAEWANEIVANLRALLRGNGNLAGGSTTVVSEDHSDGMLLAGVLNLIQRGKMKVGLDTGSTNNILVAFTPAPQELVDGMEVAVKIAATNNGAANLTTAGLTHPVVLANGAALAGGELRAGFWSVFRYNASLNTPAWQISAVVADASLVHFGTDSGSANAVSVANVTPPVSAVTAGMQFEIQKVGASNTGGMTATIAGQSGTILWADGSALAAGDWPAGVTAILEFDGGNVYHILSAMGPAVFARASSVPPALSSGSGVAIDNSHHVNLDYPDLSGVGNSPASADLLALYSAGSNFYYKLTFAQLLAAVGSVPNLVTMSSSGTYTPTAGKTRLIGFLTAGGAPGGGATNNGPTSQGSGGGAGETRLFAISLVGLGAQSVTIGAGGAGVAGGDGGSGGNSSFGSLVTAVGGLPGHSNSNEVPGGRGGAGGGGGISLAGGDGGPVYGFNGAAYGGGGGGMGGGSFWGGGASGSNNFGFGTQQNGFDAQAPGAGGGGADTGATDGYFTGTFRGGNGAAGLFVGLEF
jgi:hypothetical protein